MSILGRSLIYFLDVFQFFIIARAILSWFIRDYSNPIMQFLRQITEPIISPVRNFMNSMGLGGSMFDFSTLATYFLIEVVKMFVAVIF